MFSPPGEEITNGAWLLFGSVFDPRYGGALSAEDLAPLGLDSISVLGLQRCRAYGAGRRASSRFYLVYFVARRVAQLYAVNFFQQRVRPIRHGHCQQSRGCENPRLMQRCRGAGAGGIEFS